MAYGRTILSVTGQPLRVSSDGAPEYKQGGISIDWGTVVAVGSDMTIANSLDKIYNGQKFLRYGQVVCRIQGSADTITMNASGGTFTIGVTNTFASPTYNNSNNGIITTNPPVVGGYNTSALAFNASASAVQAALVALPNIGLDLGQSPNVNVSLNASGGTNAGVYTITFAKNLGAVTVVTAVGSLTGGTSTATVAATSNGANPGYFGPYDPSATDGRQTLTRGDCFIMDELVLQYGTQSALFSPSNDNPGGAMEGGQVWKARLLIAFASQGFAASLANGPTEAAFLTAFPRIRFSRNNENV